MKRIMFFLLALLCVSAEAVHCGETDEIREDITQGLDKRGLKAVYCDPDDPDIIYVKPKKSFKSDDKDNKTCPDPDFNPASNSPSHNQGFEIKTVLSAFDAEPGIQEIQDAAVRYAEVHKEKIDEWRRSAKQKALLPHLSVGVDHNARTTSEIYTSSTTNYWVTGPQDRTTGWDVTVSWELGDLIWNDDQTSIDVRSRLMVQLRDDIINEVTRLYFERRRLQVELLTNPPKALQAKIEKELRLQELTAGINALTGGLLSKKTG